MKAYTLSLKIAFVWDWPPTEPQVITWEDGLMAALVELRKRGHDVQVYMPGTSNYWIDHSHFRVQVCQDLVAVIGEQKPNVILHWADMTRPNAIPLYELGIPMAICFAGGEVDNYNTPYFEHIFVESEIYKEKLNNAGHNNVSIAFGTNTDLFSPIHQVKTFDTIFPATFAAWKRHDLYSHATTDLTSLACGYIYTDHEQECWQVCLDNGVTVLPHVSAPVLRYLYAASRVCVIPSRSDGGSQRTVLEAMAMNLPVVVCDSDKFDFAGDYITRVEPTIEALTEGINDSLKITNINTREYVLDNWSHIQYADALEKGLNEII